jgi:TorA maturation chaperone TorD
MLDLYDNQEAERAEIYRLFSALFLKEPSPATIEEFREMFRIKSNESPEEIQRDFADVFLRTDLHPSPYESLYNFSPGDKPGIGGKAARDVQAFYEATGLTLDEEMNLMPDHLSVELLFMSYLIDNARSGEQKDFMEQHLLPWVPAFCDEIKRHASTVFYKEAADLLKEFISSEHESMVE